MMGLRQCGWLAAGLCLLLGAAPASAKDVYTLQLPTYLKGCVCANPAERRSSLRRRNRAVARYLPWVPLL
jgi:hypothetical protein